MPNVLSTQGREGPAGSFGRSKIKTVSGVTTARAAAGDFLVVSTGLSDVDVFLQDTKDTIDDVITIMNDGPGMVYVHSPGDIKIYYSWDVYPIAPSFPCVTFVPISRNRLAVPNAPLERLWFEWNQRDLSQMTLLKGSDVDLYSYNVQVIDGISFINMGAHADAAGGDDWQKNAITALVKRAPPTLNVRVETEVLQIGRNSANQANTGVIARCGSTGEPSGYATIGYNYNASTIVYHAHGLKVQATTAELGYIVGSMAISTSSLTYGTPVAVEVMSGGTSNAQVNFEAGAKLSYNDSSSPLVGKLCGLFASPYAADETSSAYFRNIRVTLLD